MNKLSALAFALLTVPGVAFAQGAEPGAEGDAGAFDLSVTATAVSDYRFRGVSLSDRDPAIQGSVDLSFAGFYVGAWSSSIARYADTNVETDLYAGYAGEAGPVEYEIGAIAYLYPGGDGTGDVYEATGALAATVGPAKLRLAGFYAPDQKNLVGDNLYLSVDAEAEIPGTELALTAQIGRERGSFYGRKVDWSLGAEYRHGQFMLGLAYHDTDRDGVASGLGRNARGGLVAKASATF